MSTLWLTADLFERFVDGGTAPRSLRHLVTGGDVVSPAHAARFLRESPHCRLVTGYGPTENTAVTTTHHVEHAAPDRPIPIGRPVANTRVYVLDPHLEPVPAGGIGEAVLAGDGLALGWLDEEAMRERFVASPLHAGELLYRSGDRVRQRPDGVLELLGCVDGQHVIRGFRVELAGVEAALRTCPGVRGVAVTVEGQATAKQLVAAVVTEDIAAVRAFARARLPSYMIPSRFDVVGAANGKLERPAPVPPRDDLERALLATLKRDLGIHDDFFDRGGDSLRAVELVVAIERELRHEVPLATLYATPTVAAIAATIRPRTLSDELGPHLVRLRAGAVEQPLFLVAGGRGGEREAAILASLTSGLRSDQATFALLAPRLASMHAMAAQLVTEIVRIQPRGPYRLGGQCSGGCLALEVAQQLRARGETTERLLLIDSWRPSRAGTLNTIFLYRPRSLLAAGLAFLAELPARPSERWLRDLWTRAWIPRSERRHMWICQNYRPAPYDGRAILLASEDSLRLGIANPWHALVRDLEVRAMRGDQETYFKLHWRDTAERLRACMEGDT